MGYPDPIYKEVKICETANRKFKVNVQVRAKTGIKSLPGFGLRLVDARAAAAKAAVRYFRDFSPRRGTRRELFLARQQIVKRERREIEEKKRPKEKKERSFRKKEEEKIRAKEDELRRKEEEIRKREEELERKEKENGGRKKKEWPVENLLTTSNICTCVYN